MADLSGLDMIREIIGQINNWQKIVKIGGEIYKLDVKNNKYINSKGKVYTRPQLVDYIKGQKFKAPNVTDPKKVNKTLKTKITDKAKSVTSNIKSTKPQFNKEVITRPLSNLKIKFGKPNQINLDPKSTQVTNPKVLRALKMNKYLKGLTPSNVVQGVKGLGAGIGINWAAQSLFDRTMRNIEGKQDMHIDDYRVMRDERNANVPKILKTIRMHRKASQPQRIIGERGRTTGYIQPEQTGGVIGRRNEEYINREPQVSYKPDKEVPGPNTGTDSTNQNENVDKVKIKTVEKSKDKPKTYWNAPQHNITKSKNKDKKKNKFLMIGDKKASPIQKKLLKAGFTEKQLKDLVDQYNKKYRNKRGW